MSIGSNSNRRPDHVVFDKTNPIFTSDMDPVRTALDRATETVLGSIAPTVRAACNVMQPDATRRNPTQPNREMRKTNPIRPQPGFATSVASSVARMLPPRLPLGRDAQATNGARSACNAVQPSATPRDTLQPNHAACETKPIASVGPFDARQLAAARLLAMGRSTPDVARELNVCRSTVCRWQREPAFRSELRRIHERMIASAARR